jgi:hypothetical protein
MSKREINLKVLKSAVNAVLDHLLEDLGVENVTIENEKDSYWDCPYPELHDASDRFGCIQDSRAVCQGLFRWYNVRPTMRLGHSQIDQQKRRRLGAHGGAAILLRNVRHFLLLQKVARRVQDDEVMRLQ